MAIVFSVILLIVGVGVLVIIHACIIGNPLGRGFRNDNPMERGSLGSTSMSRDDVEKLPCFDFKAREYGSSTVDCAVCLEIFKVGDKCRLLPLCNHSFHAQCVDLWLLQTPICPICRTSAESREVETTESGQFSEMAVAPREGQIAESGHLSPSDAGDENQTAIVVSQLSLNVIASQVSELDYSV